MLKHFAIDSVEKEEALAKSYFIIDDSEILLKTEHLFNRCVWDDNDIEELFNSYFEFKHFNILGNLKDWKHSDFLKISGFSKSDIKNEILPRFQKSFLKHLREMDDVIEYSTSGICRNTYEQKLRERHTQLACFIVDFVAWQNSKVLQIKSTIKNYINGGQSMTALCNSGLHFN